jgi:thiol-disulfide isomerase/thioredoxin
MHRLLSLILLVSCAACPSPSGARLVDAPAGDVAPLVAAHVTANAKRTTLVYVGAAWCEPCERFRDAVKKGELNDVFGNVDFLVFDLDKDRARLEAAGYDSRMIPLVVVPDAQGRGTDRRIEGSIKGEGAVANMKPRVQALLR